MTGRSRALAVSLLTVALWSCLDGLDPGGRRASLAVFPVFDRNGVHAGGAGDADSFVITIVNPPLADQIIRRKIPAGQDTIQIAISVDLNTAEDTVDITFQGFNSATGTLLYSGSVTALLVAGLPATVPVTATYVGPGAGIDSLFVSPTALSLAPGTTQTIDVTGYDQNAPMIASDVPVFFTTDNAAVATIDAAGKVTAVAIGSTKVYATSVANSALEDTATVTVALQQPTIGLSQTSVTFNGTLGAANPAAVLINITNTGLGTLSGLAVGLVQYGAGATGWLGQPTILPTTAPATLTLAASVAGIAAAGTYTATVPVTAPNATNTPQSVSVTFIVAPPVPASITLSPGFTVMLPSSTQQLSVTAKDGLGNPTTPPAVTYTSRSPAVATVNASGMITSVAGGNAVIVASGGGLSDSMLVSVPGTGSAVAAIIGDTRAFDIRKVGDSVFVLVRVSLAALPGEKLGSYADSLRWDQSVLRYVRDTVFTGDFTSSLTVNRTLATSGILQFGAADPNGAGGANVTLLRITFVAQATGTTALTQTYSDLSGITPNFTRFLPLALIVNGSVQVVP